MKDTNSLAHTKYNCKYHIVFAPKYRRQIIYDSTSKTYFSKLSQAFLEPHFTLYGYDIGFSEAFYQF